MKAVLLTGISIILFQTSYTAVLLTSDLARSGLGHTVSVEGIQAEVEACAAFTKTRVALGHVVQQEAAMRYSTLSCLLARQF